MPELDLSYVGSKIRAMEDWRRTNLQMYNVLARQRRWPSIAELSRAHGKTSSWTCRVLKKFEMDEAIRLIRGQYSTEIVLTEKFDRYVEIWERYPKLQGLLELDIKKLVEEYPLQYAALLLGYNGSNRGYNLRLTLEKIGWL